MRKSFFFRTFASFLSVVLLFAMLVTVFWFSLVREHYMETLKAELKNIAFALSPQVFELVRGNRLSELEAVVSDVARKAGVRITVVAPDGKVLADSEKDPETMENHLNRPEIQQALKRGGGWSLRYSTTVGKELLYVAVALKKEGLVFCFLRVSMFVEKINHLLLGLQLRLLGAVLVVVLFAVFLAYVMARSIADPVKRLVEFSRELASGRLDAELRLEDEGELGFWRIL